MTNHQLVAFETDNEYRKIEQESKVNIKTAQDTNMDDFLLENPLEQA
jgi:hypothetical protein